MLLLVLACQGSDTASMDTDSAIVETSDTALTTTPTVPKVDPNSLAALAAMSWDGTKVVYEEGVVPYTLATPLFSDFALKSRAIQLPPGTQVQYTERGVFEFPLGTRIFKSFVFPADFREPTKNLRILETRVLTLTEEGWDAWPYQWNDEQTEAFRLPSGAVLNVSFVDEFGRDVEFAYLVPQRNQCVDCHERVVDGERVNFPIGPSARNLNVNDQLIRFVADGVLAGMPDISKVDAATDWSTFVDNDFSKLPDEDVEAGARDYLDANCAHCHNPEGTEGISSQLFLNHDNDDPFNFGVCKRPGSAGLGTGGLTFDIVPGNPDESIMAFRMETTKIGAMMPDIGRSLVDPEGLDIVREWITRLTGECSDQ